MADALPVGKCSKPLAAWLSAPPLPPHACTVNGTLPKTFPFYDDATYHEAVTECSAHGMQLCSIGQLEKPQTATPGSAFGTGCGTNTEPAWSAEARARCLTPRPTPLTAPTAPALGVACPLPTPPLAALPSRPSRPSPPTARLPSSRPGCLGPAASTP